MSLGSRIATRGSARAAVNASQTLVSTPREPLLFLYPQWARSSSSTAPAPRANREPPGAKTETTERNENTREKAGHTGEKIVRPRVNRGSWLLLGTSEGENVFKARRYAAANRIARSKGTSEEESKSSSDGTGGPTYTAFTRPSEIATKDRRVLADSKARTIRSRTLSAKNVGAERKGSEHWGMKRLAVGSKARTIRKPAASPKDKDGKNSRWVVVGGRLAKRPVLPMSDRLYGNVSVAEIRKSSEETPTTIEKDPYSNTFHYPLSTPNLPPATHSNYEALSAKVMLSKATRVEDPLTMLKAVERSVRLINRVAQRAQMSELSARDIREEFQEYRRVLTDN